MKRETKYHKLFTKVLVHFCVLAGIVFSVCQGIAYSQNLDSLRSQLESYTGEDSKSADSSTAVILNKISRHYRNINVDSTLHYGQRALAKVEGYGWSQIEADIRYNIAAAYYVHGEYDQTLLFARQAYEGYKESADNSEIAKVLNQEGLVFAAFDEHEKALERYNKAENLLDHGENTSLQNKINYNVAISLKEKRNSDQALEKFKNSLQLSRKLSDSLMIARNHTFIAEILISRGEFMQASDHLREAREQLTETDKWDLAFTYAAMAKLHRQKGDLREGARFGEKSYELAKEMQAQWELQRITKILADIYADLDNFEKAFEYHQEHTKWNKEVYNEQREQNLARLELARQEAENAQLKAKNEQQQHEIQETQFINISLAAGVLFVGVIAVIIYRGNRKQKALNERLSENNYIIERTKQKVEQKNEELEQLNDTKNKILSVISHDARGPMTSLHSLLEFIEQHDVSKEDMESILGSISNNLQQTTQMLDNIMHWARSQFETYEPTIRQVHLNKITSLLKDEFVWRYNKKGVVLNFEIADDAYARADENMIIIVLRNLISNALKFCEDGDSVTVTANRHQEELAISVTDTGIGLDEEAKEKIFSDKLYSNKGTDNESGSGFGLQICKEFVEMNRGSFTLEGEPGEGTTATVRLPAAAKRASEVTKDEEIA